MTGRPAIEIGKHGRVWVKRLGPGKYQARTSVRDRDGNKRDVTARGATKGAAERALERKLDTRTAPTAFGITADMTIKQLGEFWLDHRTRRGPRSDRPVKPQTLAAYSDAFRLLIVPTLGSVRIREITVGLLDAVLGDLDETGLSTAQARSVLSQMFGLAARQDALTGNPMGLVERPYREEGEVEGLELTQVRLLRSVVRPEALRRPGRRGPNGDLRDVVDVGLGTGCRIGEVLALRWIHLDLDSELPTATISGTLVEPRRGFVAKLHRQESPKSKERRTLILPDHVVAVLRARRDRSRFVGDQDPVFASRTGTWLWPSNIRTRLRAAVADHEALIGTTPHTLRRTVGTLVTHERGLDAAREQLGHSDGSVTFQRYVAARPVAPDLRDVLDRFFDPEEQAMADEMLRRHVARRR